MIKIGVGIPTCQNKIFLEKLIDSVYTYTTKIPYILFCSVDGSTDGTISMLVRKGIEFTYGPTVGPSLNLNRIFRRFIHHNYTIILNDKIEIIKDGWLETMISASNIFNYPHVVYTPGTTDSIDTLADISVGWTKEYNPAIQLYTRKTIERIGGIDDRFKYTRVGQFEHYARMMDSKLMPVTDTYPSVTTMETYIKLNNFVTPEPSDDEWNIYDKIISENKQTGTLFKKL